VTEYNKNVRQHETFYVIQRAPEAGLAAVVTVLHEVPDDAQELGSFSEPETAIDFAQQVVRRLLSEGIHAQYVDPPDDLVGCG
jgi:hypothetical protein